MNDERDARTFDEIVAAERKPRPSDRMLRFFKDANLYANLPEHFNETARLFSELAHHIAESLPEDAEKTTALRKLQEAQDCAVRAVMFNVPD